MNLSALRDRARALSGIRLQTLRSDEQVDAVINESYQEIIGLSQWPFLRASQQVSIASGIKPINAAVNSVPVAKDNNAGINFF